MKLFNKVPVSKVKKSKFDLSHENKLTCNFGDLIPVFWDYTLPGDKFRVNTQALLKLAPMQFPIMHNVNVHFYHFWTPIRTVFADFETFLTGGKDGLETVSHPFMSLNQTDNVSTLADYLGFHDEGVDSNTTEVDSIVFRVYQKIWNDYFRDQNLQDELNIPTTPGNDNVNVTLLQQLRKVAWEKDYFTSSLPWPQKGAEVLIPLENDVTYQQISTILDSTGAAADELTLAGTGSTPNGQLQVNLTGAGTGAANTPGRIENIESIANATANIESLRRSVVLQQWLEKLARGGSRMVEFVKVMFGVQIPDYRVSRPEFLGSSKQSVMISEVLSTFQNTEWAQGARSGNGFSLGSGHGFKSFFPEHGIVMSLMVIKPKSGYFQGLPRRLFRKLDKFSYPWPDFAHIGEQEVYNKEVFNKHDDLTNDDVFGYIPRYSEFKYRHNEVHGEFKTTLDAWHLDRKFASRPGLNETFITCDPDDERIWNVIDQNIDHFYVSLYHKIDAIRPLPYFGVPKL